MRITLAVVVALLVGGCGYCNVDGWSSSVRSHYPTGFEAPQPPERWQELAQGPLARVYAERAVYQVPEVEGFFVRLRIQNVTDGDIVTDLGDYRSTIRPAAWEVLSPKSQPAVTESAGVERLNDPRMDMILNDNPGPSVVRLPSKIAVDLYVLAVRRAKRLDAMSTSGTLVVDMVGEVMVTDGRQAQKIVCKAGKPMGTDLVIPLPSELAVAPSGSLMIVETGAARLSPATSPVKEPSYLVPPATVPADERWNVNTTQPATMPATAPTPPGSDL